MGVYDTAILDALPGKKPLIKLTYRPPNYETPIAYFTDAITPNDAFFVRYHLADIPDEIDPKTWKPHGRRRGRRRPFELSLDDLQCRFRAGRSRRRLPVLRQPARPFAAACRRAWNGASAPWAMRVWKGARLKDVLAKADVQKETVEIVFNGADGPVLDKTPDFVKSIPVWKALDENTLIAYEMNGAAAAALQRLSGAPRSCRAGPRPTG